MKWGQYLTWISTKLELVKKSNITSMSKSLNIPSATAQVAPELLKAPTILLKDMQLIDKTWSCMKVQAHSFSEPPMEHNHNLIPLTNQGYDLLDQFESYEVMLYYVILCNFIVLEGKAGKEIPQSSRLKFSEKFTVNIFVLLDAEYNSTGPLYREGITCSSVENTISILLEVTWAKFFGTDRLFWLISMSKFGNFKNPFATIISLSEVQVRCRRFVLLVETKKVISMSHGSNTGSWKTWRWVRLELIFVMTDKYINYNLEPFQKFGSSSRSTEFKDILPYNISQMIMKTIPINSWV